MRRKDRTLAALVGARARDLRLALRLTLRQLHERGAPTPCQMSAIENGKVDFTVETLVRVAEAIHVRPWQLLSDDAELASIDLLDARRILSVLPDLPVEPAKPLLGRAKPWHWKNERKQKRKG